jgi:hypothetical protein
MLLVANMFGLRRTLPKSQRYLLELALVDQATPFIVIAANPENGDLGTRRVLVGRLKEVKVELVFMKSPDPFNATLIGMSTTEPSVEAIPTESVLGTLHRIDLSVRAMHGFLNMEPMWIVYS